MSNKIEEQRAKLGEVQKLLKSPNDADRVAGMEQALEIAILELVAVIAQSRDHAEEIAGIQEELARLSILISTLTDLVVTVSGTVRALVAATSSGMGTTAQLKEENRGRR